MEVMADRCIFHVNSKVKQTRPGKHINTLEFIAYPNEESLCVVSHLNEYIRKTSAFRKDGMKQLMFKISSNLLDGQAKRLFSSFITSQSNKILILEELC